MLTLCPPDRRLRDDDLAYLISMNIKDLHKMCQKLKEDRLLASYGNSLLFFVIL